MKYIFLLLLTFETILSVAQQKDSALPQNITIAAGKKTRVYTSDNGELRITVSKKDLRKFKTNGWISYSDLGAAGDGKTDDIDAIAATHALANQHGLSVKSDAGATYYISGKRRVAFIQTDTDFGTSHFIIDDTDVEDRTAHVFQISSVYEPYELEGISFLHQNQTKLNVALTTKAIITVTNSNVKRYIRYGLNQNNGTSQTDVFISDKDGNVDVNTPIIWDFDQITGITARPIDDNTLTITGGRFTTIANRAESKYTYYARGIAVRRSNVLINGIEHYVTGEGEHGAPYTGFISISNCANVVVRNAVLTGHKTYKTVGSAGRSVSMGSYDIAANRALNVLFVNCRQTNDINDRTYWGIMASNFSKNLTYDSCTFSRFDAHMGVANATIRNSTMGHQGIRAIGRGTLTIENTTVYGQSLVRLRSDYGSTWQGEFVIRNCKLVTSRASSISPALIEGSYSGKHNFGYTCYMPERIIIEGLQIDDSDHPDEYRGAAILSNFNPAMTDESYQEEFPYVRTREIILRNVTTASGVPLRVSDNPFMFKDVIVRSE